MVIFNNLSLNVKILDKVQAKSISFLLQGRSEYVVVFILSNIAFVQTVIHL